MLPIFERIAKERQIRRQLERDMRIREARRRYEKFIIAEEKRNARLHKLAVDAHLVGSSVLRDKLAQIIGQTDANIKLWKERMVYFEMMQEVMSQAQACANFAEAFHSMAQSIITAANPADLARIQSDMQRSMLFAGQLNEMTEQMVEMMDSELEGQDAAQQIHTAPVLQRIIDDAESTQSEIDREIQNLRLELGADAPQMVRTAHPEPVEKR
jgi:hypothetical protein